LSCEVRVGSLQLLVQIRKGTSGELVVLGAAIPIRGLFISAEKTTHPHKGNDGRDEFYKVESEAQVPLYEIDELLLRGTIA